MTAPRHYKHLKVLCVDDEPHILAGLTRNLGLTFKVKTACGGAEALKLLESEGPFALTVSDMRMPEMNGAEYLKRAKAASPDTVRLLLTGQADFNSAVSAVNEGQIFRFLTKPCPPPVLLEATTAAAKQYELLTAERELLQKTLLGSVGVLTDVLGLLRPLVFERATRIKLITQRLAQHLGLPDAWLCELAALLLHLGYLGLDDGVLQRAYGGGKATPEERQELEAAPGAALALIEHIPRIDRVLKMLGKVEGEPEAPAREPGDESGVVEWGAHLIQLACRYDVLSLGGKAPDRALERLVSEAKFSALALTALEATLPTATWTTRKVSAFELDTSMIIDQDVRSLAGLLLVKSGQHVTPTVMKLLQRMSERGNLEDSIAVRC